MVTSSPGWLHSSMAAPSAWSMDPLGPNGSLLLMAFPKARRWPLFSITSTRRNLVLSLLPILCWVSCTLMIFRPACLHCFASDAMAAVRAMILATGALVAWMSSNRLWLNPSKPQYIWLGTRQQLAKLDLAAMAASFPHILYSLLVTVRDLWVTLDKELTFVPHINCLCRNCYFQLRQLYTISRSLTSIAILVHAFVASRLHYCSTLYVGLPAVRLGCLEWVIRTATHLIGGIPRTGHVSAYMLDVLHWLPIQQRIIFRIGALVWRRLLVLAPAYLWDLCCPTPGPRAYSSLRSIERGLLFVPFARTSTSQARAFSVVGPSVWNGLPVAQRLLPRFFPTHSTVA